MLTSNLHVGSRLRGLGRNECGVSLIELLIAAAMGVVVMGAVASLVISAVRAQPKISQEANSITTAQWVLGRMTRELRNGRQVTEATPSRISFETYVRHSPCGEDTSLASSQPAELCQVTYECTTTTCSRTEGPIGSTTGAPIQVFSGIDTDQVFSYSPEECVAEDCDPVHVTFVKVTLRMPNPRGSGDLTVSDGASLRNSPANLVR